MIRRKLKVQPELFLVAHVNGQVVGTVMAGFDGVRGWVHHLAVRGSHRHQGIASSLMIAAEKGLEASGCPKVNLQVRATNSAVIAFYRSLGYEVEERASLGKRLGAA
jgi:ribosomal protein S18 acetylase RimI-like enzyme